MKYIKVCLPCNEIYFVVEDDTDISSVDVLNNKPKDANGNEVKPLQVIHRLGVIQEGAKATITQIDTLPFPSPPE